MSKTKIFLLALLAFTIASFGPFHFSGGPFTGPPAVGQAEERTLTLDLNLESESAGIKLRLIQAIFSSTRTEVVLELTNPVVKEAGRSPLFGPIFEEDVEVQGVDEGVFWVDGAFIAQVPGSTRNGIVRRSLIVAPLKGADVPVNIEIRRLCVLLDRLDDDCTTVEGHWSFEFLPGPDAADPMSSAIQVDLNEEHDGISVSILGVAMSSNELLVRYKIEGDGVSTYAPGFGVRMIGADGSFVDIIHERYSRDGSRIASFPAVVHDTNSIRLSISSLFKVGNGLGEAPVPLDSKVAVEDVFAEEPTVITVGQDVRYPGEAFRIEQVVVGRDVIEMAISTLAGSGGIAPSGMTGGMAVGDDAGNVYAATAGLLTFVEDDNGFLRVGMAMYRFEGISAIELSSLRLMSGSSLNLVKGPWEFLLELP